MIKKENIYLSLIFLGLDLLWIKFYMGPQYFKLVKKIQKTDLQINKYYAIAAYIAIIIGLNVFVLPNIRKEHLILDCIKYGFTYGAVLYAVYDFTCGAIFKEWDLKLAIVDILWGGIASALSLFILFKLIK